jgi:hypothetical protein
MKKIKTLGGRISREEAIEFVFEDISCEIYDAGNTAYLYHILVECKNWRPISTWSNEKLEGYISKIEIENESNTND